MLQGLKNFFVGSQTPEEEKAQAHKEQQLADQYGFDMLGVEQPFLDPVDMFASGAAFLPRGLLAALAEAGSDAVFSLALEHGIDHDADHLKAIYLGQRGMKAMGIDASRDLAGQFSGMHDKMVRKEIDNPELLRPVTKADAHSDFYLDELVELDDLGKAYPSLVEDVTVRVDPTLLPDEGGFSPRSKIINLGPAKAYKSSDVARQETALTHELQHAIDINEGFPRGGSPDENWVTAKQNINMSERNFDLRRKHEDAELLAMQNPTAKNKATAQIAKKEYYDAIAQSNKSAANIKEGPDEAYGNYRRLAGEVQARDAERTNKFSPEGRARIQPFSGRFYDKGEAKHIHSNPVDIDDLIIDYTTPTSIQGNVKPLDVNDIPLD